MNHGNVMSHDDLLTAASPSSPLSETSSRPAGLIGRIAPAGWLDRAVAVLNALLLLAVVLVTVLQVVMRYAFGAALPWPEEIALWSFLWLVMFGIASVTRTGGHIRVDALIAQLPRPAHRVAELFVVALTALSFGLLGILGVRLAEGTTMVTINLNIPYSELYLALPVGAALSLINLARSDVSLCSRVSVLAATVVGALLAIPALTQLAPVLDGSNPTALGLALLIVLIILGIPIAHALLLGAFAAFQAGGLPDVVIANHFASTMATNFVLLAIPFFVLMGALMNVGGVTTALIDTANALVGHWRGGLAQVNIVTSALMGGLSGSSSADTAMTTKTLVPQMERAGYDRAFSCALTASSSITANLIPPSITLLIYASLASQSVGALFMSGIVPGVLYVATLMITVALLARSETFRVERAERIAWRARSRIAIRASAALALPLVIVMMLRGGTVTPTEAGAIASVYALAIGVFVYGGVSPTRVWQSLCETGREVSIILFLIAASGPMAWLIVAEGVPQDLAATLGATVTSPPVMMLGLVALMVVVGLFLEPAPAMVILVPVILPVAKTVGIDPIHLGVVVVTTVMIGQLTPPVGGLVFITSSLANLPVFRVFWALRWIYLALALFIAVLALVPPISLAVPHALGFH